MKNWQITGFIAILILGFLLIGGCTSKGSTSAAPVAVSTPTPQIIYVTVTVTPTPTFALSKDPIIGVWRFISSDGYDDRYRFNADGTFVESFYFTDKQTTSVFRGTWSAHGGNSYTTINTADMSSATFIYDPTRNIIYDSKYENLVFIPYQGDVAAASASASGSLSSGATPKYKVGDIVWKSGSNYDTNVHSLRGLYIVSVNAASYNIEYIWKDDGETHWSRLYPDILNYDIDIIENKYPRIVDHVSVSTISSDYPSKAAFDAAT